MSAPVSNVLSEIGELCHGTVVAIPTFRRKESLTRLLDSIAADGGMDLRAVVVGDNDCSYEIEQLVAGYAQRGMPAHYVAVRQRGIAQVRNGLVDHIERTLAGWHWIVMFDDDGLPAAGCIRALIATGNALEAHLVGGPVLGALPARAGILARNSIFAARRRWQTGLVPTLNGAQNLAVSRRVFGLLAAPLFRAEYGASGGEDYDLFRRVAAAGGRIAWCDQAVVSEPAPAERITHHAIIERYFTTGLYMAVIDRSYDGWAQSVRVATNGVAKSCTSALLGIMLLDAPRSARGVLNIAHHFGRMAGLVGVRSSRYVRKKDVL